MAGSPSSSPSSDLAGLRRTLLKDDFDVEKHASELIRTGATSPPTCRT